MNAVSLTAGVNSSFPTTNGWTGLVNNSSGETGSFLKACVVCGTVPGYRLLTGKARAVLPLSQAMLTANCPSGSVIIGGGAGVNTSNLGVNLNMTGPIDPTAEAVLNGPRPSFGWNTIVNNNNEVAATASPFAICAGG